MKKAAILGAVCAALLLGAYLATGRLVEMATEKAVAHIRGEAPNHGIRVVSLTYREAFFRLPGTMYWTGVHSVLQVRPRSFLPGNGDLSVDAGRILLRLERPKERSFLLQAEDISVSFPQEGGEQGRSENLLRGKKAEIRFTLNSLAPAPMKEEAKAVADQLEELLRTGKSPLSVAFTGEVSLRLGGETVRTRIRIEEVDGQSTVVIQEGAVADFAGKFGLKQPLTGSEVKLIARNPLKAHRLFEIRTDARDTSRKASRGKSGVPQDAYRHVLWSYLLTKEYGEAFAEEVTDAHEEGNTGNTTEERLMDLENNTLGREYARLGRRRSDILGLVMKDPRVVRSPKELSR